MSLPIAVFAYNRPDHLAETLAALKLNPEAERSKMIIFCDGAKTEADICATKNVRAVAKNITGFKSLEVIERSGNLGLANSIITGVTQLTSEFDGIVVMEDDIVVSSTFLKFMNDGYNMYKDHPNVCSIHGYTYPVDIKLPETFFLKGADCWGWTTWKSAWNHFNPNSAQLLKSIKSKNLTYDFDVKGAYPYVNMLQNQIDGKINSWAIRWRASAFLDNMYTLYPGKSLARNIGFDGSGIHCTNSYEYETTSHDEAVSIKKQEIVELPEVTDGLRDYFLTMKSKKSLCRYYVRRTIYNVMKRDIINVSG